MVQFHPGDVILKSEPFAYVILSSHRTRICAYCWTLLETSSIVTCPSCPLVSYCSQKCREENSQEHLRECTVLGKVGSLISDQLRLVMKIWLKLRGKEDNDFREEGENISKSWNSLIDHYEDLVNDSKDLLTAQYKVLETHINKSDLPSMEEFITIYGKILTNSFSLRSDRYSCPEPFGTGVYLLASVFDHSCTPNCTVVFQGRKIIAMATEEIPEGDIPDVAFISYINTIDDTNTRRLQQRAIWYFQCQCSLCANQRIDQEKHSLRCGGCDKGRPVDIMNWNLYGDKCTYCKYGAKEKEKEEDKIKLTRYRELYKILTDGDDGSGHSQMPYEELCEWCVGEMEPVFSDRDVIYVQTVHYVHTLCIQNKRWSAAAMYGETILPAFRLYYGHSTGVVAGLLVRLAQAMAETGNMARSEYLFNEAEKIYKVVPGVHHPFYTEDFRPLYEQYLDS